ncbi:ATPase [Coniochaeta sp. 2T2.1]|nr:ATPase [Coniochaeta sp. 2T2.1]
MAGNGFVSHYHGITTLPSLPNIVQPGDDDSLSTASFEEVGPGGRKHTKDMVIRSKSSKDDVSDDVVPDVLYVVHYRGLDGRLIDSRKSSKPLDIALDAEDSSSSGQKKASPVLEIVTKVSATRPRHDRRRYPPPQRYNYGGYTSDSDIDITIKDEVTVTKVETTEMVIHSKPLRDALNAVVNYYPGVDFLGDRVTVEAPYRVLVHHAKDLELYKVNQPIAHNAETRAITAKHIDILLGFLRETLGEQMAAEEARWHSATPLVTFENFWMVMRPGEVIYRKEGGHWTPFVVSRVSTGHAGRGAASTATHNKPAYVVDCWNVEFVDGKVQRLMESFYIYPFNGEQAIQSLPVIPARFFPGGAKANADRQVKLGREYWELCKRPAYKEYDGAMVGRDGCPTGNLTGRVIVDCEGYDKFRDNNGPRSRLPPPPMPRRGQPLPPNPIPPKDQLPQFKSRCPCAACGAGDMKEIESPFAGFEDLDPNEDAPPENDLFFTVLADTIPAFILSERRWAMLKVSDLTDVKPDREAFKYLVLDDDIKLTVKALIGKFASSDGKVSPWPNDFVKNKGEGRIFLLHGSPGVGKTCTAECVAELTHRPLLSLTSGDISTSMSASSVERNLNYFLQLGERWGALVLIDESDVYLEERRTKDLHRNGLVSIFLRALEYYKGVLFLTTNRVAAFDSAFTSRIHVALHYKKLTDEDRMRVWMNNFERLERDSGGKCFVPQSARQYAYESEEVKDLRWNGREIRNGLQTAVALAETEALEDGVGTVTVTDKHLRAVAKMSKGFKDFLRKRRGYEEDEDEDEDDDEASSSSGSGSTYMGDVRD